MDEYTVQFAGDFLQADELDFLLDKLPAVRLARAGETKAISYGREREHPRNVPYETTCCDFEAKDFSLIALLEYLSAKGVKVGNYGIEELILSAYCEREGQMNGELSEREIDGLASLGAAYTWSVYMTDMD